MTSPDEELPRDRRRVLNIRVFLFEVADKADELNTHRLGAESHDESGRGGCVRAPEVSIIKGVLPEITDVLTAQVQ